MATLAELRARRATLEAQAASGFARVTFDGRTVDYRSQAEIERAIVRIDDQIAAAEGRSRSRVIYIAGAKWL